MNSKLSQQVSALADVEDIDGLTDLLLNWPERNAERLLFAQMRVFAPSSSSEQRQQLKKVINKALAENPTLSTDELFDFPETEQNPDTNHNIEEQEAKTMVEEFVLSEEDKTNYDIIDTVEDFYEWEEDDIDEYLASLGYDSLIRPMQHLIHKIVYWLSANDWLGETSRIIENSETYRDWLQQFAPENVLNNPELSAKDLIQHCQLENDIIMIGKRHYYDYLLERGDTDYPTLQHFINKVGGLHDLSKTATEDEVTAFEAKHSVKFPRELSDFYQKIGQLNGTVDQDYNIPSLKGMDYALDESTEKWRRLYGLGLVHELNSVWGNSKEDFDPNRGGILSAEQVATLNAQYTSIGSLRVDDNSVVAIYFDKQNRFGAVWYNQDDTVVVHDYLYPLLEASQAQYGFYQLINALVFWLSIDEMAEDYPSLIASLRAK